MRGGRESHLGTRFRRGSDMQSKGQFASDINRFDSGKPSASIRNRESHGVGESDHVDL